MGLDRVTPCAADYDLWSYSCSECPEVFSMVEVRMAERGLIDERRVVLRHAVTTPATIELNSKAIACTVHDVSATGAHLSLSGRPRLPKRFALTTAGSALSCRPVWRRGRKIGVAFE